MRRIEIRTEAQFQAALKIEDVILVLLEGAYSLVTRGAWSPWLEVSAGVSLSVEAWGTSQPHVVARETSQPHVEAWETSQPHVVARETSQPHVVARETSQPHVEAWETSQPHVEAWGTSQPHVEAWGTSQPHVVARETSQPHVVAWETSQPHVEAWETSQPHVEAWGTSQPHVVAWETSQPHVEAWGTSQPHVVARETSQPHVEAWGTSQPHVVARGTSQPHVVARGYVQLSLAGRVLAKASAKVAVLMRGELPTCDGGQQTRYQVRTAEEWCEFYGLEPEGGLVTLYKAVDDDYSTSHARAAGIVYAPGATPEAPDWDGGEQECGKGLHFSPSPGHALGFNPQAKRFVACPVALATIAVHEDGAYPEKVKAPRVAAPIWEVDRRGKRIEVAS